MSKDGPVTKEEVDGFPYNTYPKVWFYHGRKLTDMSREELISALEDSATRLQNYLNRDIERGDRIAESFKEQAARNLNALKS